MQPKYLQLIDTQTNGQRYDVTPLFADHESFSALVGDIEAAFCKMNLILSWRFTHWDLL